MAAFAGLAPLLPGSLKQDTGSPKEDPISKSMFVHHVFFWLKNPDSAADRAKLLEGIRSLQPIETIRTFHVGKPAGTDRPVIENGYDFSLLLMFDNPEDQNTYQEHPVHLKFVDEYAHLWSKVIVYDSVDV